MTKKAKLEAITQKCKAVIDLYERYYKPVHYFEKANFAEEILSIVEGSYYD